MNPQHPKGRANSLDSRIGGKAERKLIRMIQEMQGEEPCFQSGKQACDRVDCGWRRECMAGLEQRTGLQ